VRTGLRDRFTRRLRGWLESPEPRSLGALVRGTPAGPDTDPDGQVPHWLFAFDAAGAATFRALALLATHPDVPHDDAYLRAAVQESVRLWPTTLVVLRDSTTETRWDGVVAPAGTAFAIVSSFFHRDERLLPYADRFVPRIWLDGRVSQGALIPFSAGPASCPGRDLVLLTTATMLAALLERHEFQPVDRPDLYPGRPLPRTLDHFRLRFAVTAR
jgi:cytochrome P450